MNKPVAAVVLPLRFAWAMITSGAQTIGAILRQGLSLGTPPPPAFVRIGFAPMSAQGAALLGCMISLTPGTTVIDIDMARRQLVLHVLDASHAAAAATAIRRDFEPPLLAWFGDTA
ncbi:MAG: Na+/H+ antiporter subunit E [Betaproteobacteria bacterium]|nr:Na+/H+ antiporter subunit E [Betaproteobacteria bacterium]